MDTFFGNAEQKKGHHLQHLKNKMSLIPWSMKLDLVCAEGDSAKMVDFFSSSSTALCTGQLEKWSNYSRGSLQSFECRFLYTYQKRVMVCYNSPS